MRPIQVAVRNVRGAGDVQLNLRPFSALIGPNNAGKTTLLDAVRLFYGSLTWDAERDRPWGAADDEPSWVEITYAMSEAEADEFFFPGVDPSETDREEGLTGLGLLDGGTLRVRRRLTGDGAGEYRYVSPNGGEEATGWDTASGRLGMCVYVPTQAQLRDQMSLSGPSPLRDVLMLAFGRRDVMTYLDAVDNTLAGLRRHLADGPIASLESDLDQALRPWGISAEVGLGELSGQFIMQHLIELRLHQEGALQAPEAQGSGVQRALIAALIQAAAGLRANAEKNDFRWVLFEEPEAFLHPAQVTRLAQDLLKLTESGDTAVTITTHDPTTLSASETPPEGIARIQRDKTEIRAVSPSPAAVRAALDEIQVRSVYAQASNHCFTKRWPERTEEELRRRVLYDLDARRAAAFFADRVIVVEGMSDVVFFEWLDRRGLMSALGPNVGVLDAGGKFELHRAARTLSLFGIPHVVLWDEDAAMRPPDTHKYKEQRCRDDAAMLTLCAAANDTGSTLAGAVRLSGTIERWLGIAEERIGAWKSANIGAALSIDARPGSALRDRVGALIDLLRDLFDGIDPADHKKRPEFSGAEIALTLPVPSNDLSAVVATLPRPACACTIAASWQRASATP